MVRTLKEQLLHNGTFGTLAELRQAPDQFADVYNERWMRQRHGHKTPHQIRAEQKEMALEEGAESLIRRAA